MNCFRNKPVHGAAASRVLLGFLLATALGSPLIARSAQHIPDVLTVGTFQGVKGQYRSIQNAIDAAKPGDYVLIAPGDYHPTAHSRQAGLFITTPGIHIRGMARNRTIIDGTRPGSDRACTPLKKFQNFGPKDKDGAATGRNGVWIRQTSGVSVENLTICNFLASSGYGRGNQLFFDGNEDTPIGMHSYRGAYVSTTSSYFDPEHYGNYGLFSSSADGPGLFIHTYANNMADSDYYIGACPDCNAVIDDAHAENSALGYSGTNSGGRIVIKNSEWDHNKAGLVTNSQSVGDPPPPQDGACTTDAQQPTVPSSVQTKHCWILRHNYIHDNNNANAPQKPGQVALVPVGAGAVVAGGRNDIISNNLIANNGSWGVLLTVFPDSPAPRNGAPKPKNDRDQIQPDCRPGANYPDTIDACIFDVVGVEVAGNKFSNNGSFGNPTNGDLAEYSDPSNILDNLSGGETFNQRTPEPQVVNCWHDNTDLTGSVTSAPAGLQQSHRVCGQTNRPGSSDFQLFNQILCATGATVAGIGCQNKAQVNYPRLKQVSLMPLPLEKTMPDPCKGVPNNRFCKALRASHPARAGT